MYSLLIADDEFELRNGLCKYFPWEEVGFEVVGHVENGRQALAFIENHPVDVLLCDIKMPVMDGLELAEELHTRRLPVKVIFLSGYRSFEFAQKALALGVKDYIVKSTKFNELVNVFKKIRQDLDEESAFRGACVGAKAGEEESQGYYELLIGRIKGYVRDHYQDVTLEDIAQVVHMHPNYVSKIFCRKTGQHFSDYLLSVRMEKAKDLLSDIRYKTYEVSEMLGYRNSKNFTRAFKYYYGKTPRDFRNNGSLN